MNDLLLLPRPRRLEQTAGMVNPSKLEVRERDPIVACRGVQGSDQYKILYISNLS
jgi:hypothetical protein